MPAVIPQRMAAQIEGDFVVFLIGIRVNKPWKVYKWLPAILAMPRMIKELEASPSSETGFLGHNGVGLGMVQYWRSFEHLERYARSRDREHWPAWVAFNQRVGGARGDVGIWHETYLVKAGQYESVYSGMPPYGLGKAASLVLASARGETAKARLSAGDGSKSE